MSQPTVLHVVTRLSPGGPTVLLKELSEQPRDHRMVIAAGEPDPDEPEHADPPVMGCEVVSLPQMRQGQPVRSLARVGRSVDDVARRVGADVVHSHTTVAGYSRTGRLAVPRVHTFHGTVHSGHFGGAVSAALRYGERALASRSAAVVAVADHDARSLLADGIRGRDGTVHVIPPPLQRDFVTAPTGAPLADRDAVVGFVGRLARIKRIDVLCAAMRIVLDEVATATFEVLGDGPEAWRVERLAAAYPGRVVRHGWVAASRGVRERFRVEVLTSDSEGMPMAVLEALVLGTPVVATDVGGLSDLSRLIDGRGLRLVPRGQAGAVAAGVLEQLKGTVPVAADAVRRQFAPSRVAALHDELYHKVVAAH